MFPRTLLPPDIKVKEQSFENMARGRKIYEPPRYMTVNQCVAQLLEVEEKMQLGVCGPEKMAVGVARVGSLDQVRGWPAACTLCWLKVLFLFLFLFYFILLYFLLLQTVVAAPLRDLLTVDFGGPLHSLVLVGETDEIEAAMLKRYAITDATPRLAPAPTAQEEE